jgi:hypothetical protein
MAVLAWVEKDVDPAVRETKVVECEDWLHKVSRWESYVLDTRIGIKVTTAVDTLRMYKKERGLG